MAKLTLFYDGSCPLCVREMAALAKRDADNNILTIDINSEEFNHYHQIDYLQAQNILHGLDEKGDLYLGLDAVHKAWTFAGRGWLYAPSRWRLIKPMADKLYLLFARNRYRISFLLTGKARCDCNRLD